MPKILPTLHARKLQDGTIDLSLSPKFTFLVSTIKIKNTIDHANNPRLGQRRYEFKGKTYHLQWYLCEPYITTHQIITDNIDPDFSKEDLQEQLRYMTADSLQQFLLLNSDNNIEIKLFRALPKREIVDYINYLKTFIADRD